MQDSKSLVTFVCHSWGPSQPPFTTLKTTIYTFISWQNKEFSYSVIIEGLTRAMNLFTVWQVCFLLAHTYFTVQPTKNL